MRGLKRSSLGESKQFGKVASFTDAWIETELVANNLTCCHVASFTDAWIETRWVYCMVIPFASHLLQIRGLKLSASTLSSGGTVASFTDAWIETCKPALKTRPLLVASFTDAWIETNYRQKEHRHH